MQQDDDRSMSSGDESDDGDLTEADRTDSEFAASPGTSNPHFYHVAQMH